ncbi:MAG: histidine phosphatase family protein [Glaciihabitans sp.]|jgi:broad specificity phosphatase PhoE|nr:histidine phosphatase family protein [Glaciihabitans sp.]
MKLIFVRHAQTPANVRGELDTAYPGPKLTALGHQQARKLPDALADHQIEAIFASSLIRTQLTADALADHRALDIRVQHGLHEIEAGALEKRRDMDSVRTYLRSAFAWGAGDRDVRIPGGPDGHEFFYRYDNAVAEIAATGVETAAVFSHGAAIRVWVAARSQNVSPMFAAEHELDNTGVIVLEGSPDAGWTLISWAGNPVGGASLADPTAPDPTGLPID